jgi:hypothetical protein
LEEVARRAKSYGLEVVMINVWEHLKATEEAQHFCSVHKLNGPVLIDTEAEYMTRLGLKGVPINIVVNKKGIVQAVGVTTPDEVRATLTKLLLPFG